LRTLLLILAFPASVSFAQFPENYTPTYPEAVKAYENLAADHRKSARLFRNDTTDSGLPLLTFVIDSKGTFDPEKIHEEKRVVCLIMNGIHAGEPGGVNASIAFAKARLENPDDDVVYVIIPVYNIGGALNRNSTSRVNQMGPAEYGFRGNARNLDLNRDFIKSDSRNARAFAKIFHHWGPEVFVDTHTTNGADYPAAMTLIHSIPEKYHTLQASFLMRDFLPALFSGMAERNEPMTPYVDFRGKTPESGLDLFNDRPRYSTGYVALFNTFGFTSEAHMLKPFDKRVEATLNFLKTLHTFMSTKRDLIVQLKRVADEETATTRQFTTNWKLSEMADSISFSGYRADSITSEVTGLPRIRYNRDKPYTEKIPYFNTNEATYKTILPAFYLIPQAWTEVISRLRENDIAIERLKSDTLIKVRSTYIRDYETVAKPYEGHYLHSNTTAGSRTQDVQFYAGDYLIRTNQTGNRFLANVLDPVSPDSYFNWNYFDSVIMQKEYFSDYLFEDTAIEVLKENSVLRKAFEAKKKEDSTFAKDGPAQLDFIYRNSKYYETTHMRLPVFSSEAD